jgi:tetratricopeptide (TPR) repeat protein
VVPGYEVLGVLGEGGVGVVYKARHLRLNRLVALKMLRAGPHASARMLDRFQTEAEIVARLQHPNIVQVYEVGEHDGLPFLAMEYIGGGNLMACTASRPQPARDTAALVAVLARAMHYAHQRGVVHRDLKPGNVLLEKETDTDAASGSPHGSGDDPFLIRVDPCRPGSSSSPLLPKITDFGLAKDTGGGGGRTHSGDVLGTPNYMAPEQAAGKASEVGPRTDVYALGAILYELLTGRPPFMAETAADTVLQVLRADPVPPTRLRAQMPRDLETICLKCLEKQPAARYATAAELAKDLGLYLEGRPIRARRSPAWERAVKWARRRPAVAGLIFVSALALLALVVAGLREDQRRVQARREVEETMARGQEAYLAGDWAAAYPHFENALARVRSEPGLGDLLPMAQRLRDEAQSRRERDEGARKADATYRAFLRWRDEAYFHSQHILSGVGLELGRSPDEHRQAAARAAREALALVGVALDGDASWSPDRALADPHRRAEVAEGCYTLLVLLANAVAARPPAGRAEWREALRIVERVPAVHAPTAAYHRSRAEFRRRLGHNEEAERTDPASALDWFLLGYADLQRGDIDGAHRAFDTALTLQPNHFWAQFYLAECHLRRREWDAAQAYLRGCAEQRPDFVWAYLRRGWASTEHQAWSAAEADLGKAQELLDRAAVGRVARR